MLTHQIPQQPPSKAKTTSNAVKLRKITWVICKTNAHEFSWEYKQLT